MNRKNRFALSESQTGYLLVLPVLLMIAVIAVWPVVRSFWLSLYDIRLNDPAKSSIHTDYGIDLELLSEKRYVLLKLLEQKASDATGEDKSALEDVRNRIEQLPSALGDDEVQHKLDQINRLLNAFMPVPQTLAKAKLDPANARSYLSTLDEADRTFTTLSSESGNIADLRGLIASLKLSVSQPNYVGIQHYTYLFGEARLWQSIWNTTVFTVLSVSAELVLGLLIALLINRPFVGREAVRAAVLIPWAIPTVISALMWRFLYDGQNGIVAKFFGWIGIIPDMSALLTTKWGAMFALVFADVWKTTPFMALLLFAGLQTIPDSLYEAAKIDGASKLQQFRKVTLPLLKSTILVALLFRTLDAFRVFDLVYVLTNGGPANGTETISMYAYKMMFAQLNFGLGSALSVIVFLCIALISILFIKALGSDLVKADTAK